MNGNVTKALQDTNGYVAKQAKDLKITPGGTTYYVDKSKAHKLTETKAKVKVNVVNEQNSIKKPTKRVVKTKNTIKESKFTKQDLKNLLLKLRSQD